MKGSTGGDVFTAADVARFCGVDAKTIHHWADKGKLRHRKTDGGHVRVERTDLVAFLRAYSFPIPDALRKGKPAIAIVADDERRRSALARALARRFDVASFAHAIDALLAMGARAPQGLALVVPCAEVDAGAVIARLRAADATGHVRVVAIAGPADATSLLDAGAAGVIDRAAPPSRVRDALAELTGLA